MSYQVKLNLENNEDIVAMNADDAGHQAQPAAAEATVQSCVRHWLLDDPTGRDLLKVRMMQIYPFEDAQFWSSTSSPELDEALEEMVDNLGLRELEQPVGMIPWTKTQIKLLGLQAKIVMRQAA